MEKETIEKETIERLDGVLATYKCLLSCCKKMPGMRIEDLFSDNAVLSLEKEYAWLICVCDAFRGTLNKEQ
jgi:hypothetical protein